MPRWLSGSAWALLIWTLFQTLSFHRSLIQFPYPLDVNEPAQAYLAQAVAAGKSSGDISAFPELCAHYGPGHSLLTGALCARGWACSLQEQRLLSGLLIALILIGMALALRRAGLAALESGGLLVWAYVMLLVNLTPAARPDALGLCLWFWGLLLPFLFPASWLALGAAALLFHLAFLTKIYYWWGAAALFLALLERPRRAAAFTLFFGATALLTLAWLLHRSPYAFYESILLQAQNDNTAYDVSHMFWQLKALFVQMAPLSLPLIALALWLRRPGKQPRIWGASALLGTAIFGLLLGGAKGGKFIYAVQFVLLPGLLWLGMALSRNLRWRAVIAAMLVFNAAWAAHMTQHALFKPGSRTEQEWAKAQALVNAAKQPFVSSEFALTLLERGQPVFDTGLSDELRFAAEPQGWKAKAFPRWRDLLRQDEAWRARARAHLADPKTDLVFINPESPLVFPDLLRARFKPTQKLLLFYPQTGGGSMILHFDRRP